MTGEATIITSKIAAPFISKIFDKIDADNVNVIGVPKEIACLITKKTLTNWFEWSETGSYY